MSLDILTARGVKAVLWLLALAWLGYDFMVNLFWLCLAVSSVAVIWGILQVPAAEPGPGFQNPSLPQLDDVYELVQPVPSM